MPGYADMIADPDLSFSSSKTQIPSAIGFQSNFRKPLGLVVILRRVSTCSVF